MLENLNVNSSLNELSEIQETIKISNYEITPILDQNQLIETLNKNKFNAEIIPGFYDQVEELSEYERKKMNKNGLDEKIFKESACRRLE